MLAKTNVDASAVKGIGLTGQMHGLVLLDEKGEVLRPALLWNDQRTAAQCDAIRLKLGREKLIQITGNDALTGFTAPKIFWVQEHEPEIWKRVRHILLPKDYVRYKMTGEFAVDCADGAGTILFDLKKRNWSQEVLAALDIPFEYLPKVYEGTDITGTLLPNVADELGLPAGIPIIGGGGDQAASAVGTGAVSAGVASLSLGTSGVVFVTTDTPAIEPEGRLHAFCHSVPGKWHFMGVMLSAAGSLRWHRDTFAPVSGTINFLNQPPTFSPAATVCSSFPTYRRANPASRPIGAWSFRWANRTPHLAPPYPLCYRRRFFRITRQFRADKECWSGAN